MTKVSPYDSITFGNSLSLRVDAGVGAVSINPSGRDVVLAGRRGLYVVDLDDPFAPPRWLHHLTSWEVADVQWSPHVSKPGWVISTSNQKALIWNLARTSDNAIEHVLHGHSRAITDINFHPENPELVATCSVDTFVLAWDIRTPKRPIFAAADWRAGASQVKWNFKNPNILASSHDHYFYLWDIRNNSSPLHKINAHSRKVNGVDFSRNKELEIISCSNDNTVKYWDLSKDTENPITIISTDFPVWRARHLPFGNGCSIMPLRGGNNSVYLVNHKDEEGEIKMKPCYVFKGHSDRVTDFLWRSRYSNSGVDDREFQLVTWSKDCDLRLWSMNEEIYKKLDYTRSKEMHLPNFEYKTYREEPGVVAQNQLSMKKTKDTFVSSKGESTNTDDHLNWISGVRIGRSAFAPPIDQNPNRTLDNSPDNLGEEVSVVGHKFPKVRFEKISVSTGILILSLSGPWSSDPDQLVFLRIEIKYPKTYPKNPPSFRIEENRDIEQDKRQEILQNLNDIAKKYASIEKFSLEVCLRFLMGEKIDLTSLDKDDDFTIPIEDFDEISSLSSSLSSSEADDDDEDEDVMLLTRSELAPNFDSTPIPKGCGAVWSKSGHLVCFFITKQNVKVQNNFKFDQKGFSNQVLVDDDDELSDDSLLDDWNDILKNDMTSRTKIPGVFKIQNYATNTHIPSLPTEKSNGTEKISNKNTIKIYDLKYLIPSKMELASEYKILGDLPEKLAIHNTEVCLKYGYTNLADTWRIVASIFSRNFYWGTHPFGGTWLVKELMDYYEKLGNIQMLAMLSCVIFSEQIQPVSLLDENRLGNTPDNTSVSTNICRPSSVCSHERPSTNGFVDMNYRLSFSRSSSILTKENDKKPSLKIEMMNEVELGFGENQLKVLLLKDEDRYRAYRKQYADILYNWNLPLSRIEVLKFNYGKEQSPVFDIHKTKFSWLDSSGMDCNYCGLKVKRRMFVCYKCEHAMHAQCADDWWKVSEECASGCGCKCLIMDNIS